MNDIQQTIESEPITSSQQDHSAPSVTAVNPASGVAVLLCSLVVTLVVCSKRSSAFRTRWKERLAPHPIPCYRCQFFSNNPFLKCAVHPNVVLSQQAVDCSDYCPYQGYKRK
ncbi:hypothetical protein ACQ4M3_05935 [Leptolyngbya sp. AN03gr2]|uniref:hypothetical protein n=1 Tax=Leptolyngbya sp. AN10 TaxID=3423365 RepID=UPI003D320B07